MRKLEIIVASLILLPMGGRASEDKPDKIVVNVKILGELKPDLGRVQIQESFKCQMPYTVFLFDISKDIPPSVIYFHTIRMHGKSFSPTFITLIFNDKHRISPHRLDNIIKVCCAMRYLLQQDAVTHHTGSGEILWHTIFSQQ